MPGAPQAKFEFVATGDASVNAQIEGVVNKLVRMKQQAQDTQKTMVDGTERARATIHLLSDDLQLRIPRALQTILARIPAVQTAISGLLGFGAATVGAKILFDVGQQVYDVYKKWTDVDEVVQEYNKRLDDSTQKLAQQATSIEQVLSNLQNANQQADIFDRLRLQAAKNKNNVSFFDDPLEYIFSRADEKDAAKLQFKAKEEQARSQAAAIKEQGNETERLIGQEKELKDARLEGAAKILADEQADNRLADAKLDTLQKQNALINGQITAYNAEHRDQLALIPADAGQLDNQLAKFYNRQKALAELARLRQDAQLSLQDFAATTKQAEGKANTELTIDPLEKNLQDVRNKWDNIINEYKDKTDKLIKVLKNSGVNVANLLKEQADTLVKLKQAEGQALADQEKKNQVILNTAFGLITPGKVPAALFVSNDDNVARQQADDLIKRINDDLAAEAAAEAELKDKAQATGESQIDLETQLRDLRISTADKTKDLVTQVLALAQAMHDGIGDPSLIAQVQKLESKLDSLRVKTKTWQIELKQTFLNDFQNAFTGIVTGTETVSQAFQKMAQSILAELAKIVYQMYIVKLLQAAISGSGGGGLSAAQPGLNDAGFGGIIPHAAGGPMLSGMTYLVGERGPELMTVGAGGYMTPNSMLGKGAAAPVINIHNYGPPMETQQSSRFDGEQFVIDVVVRNIQNNGAIRQQMR